MISRLILRKLERKLQLDPPLTRRITVQRNLRIPMPDGVELLADRWLPRSGGDGLPTALLRTPYGRGTYGAILARPLAERGYQVVIQSVRGGFGSGGTLDPMRQERADGLATLDWLVAQPWSDAIVLYGPSYLGYVQWAVADQLPPQVKAMIPVVTESALTLESLRPGGMSLEASFEWSVLIGTQERPLSGLRKMSQDKKTARALWTLPLAEADIAAFGERSPYFQDTLTHDATSPRWDGIDHSHRVADVTVPVSSVGGWYDIFLPGQLRDFQVLQEKGRSARLTVGPWTHAEFTGTPIEEAVNFGLAHARGVQPPHRAPVRLYVMGEDAWRSFDSWPPAGYSPQRFHLGAAGALTSEPPAESSVDTYRYDPADPTPTAGGVRLAVGAAGRAENTELEARPDVLTYTTPVLDQDVEVVGEVSAEIWFSCSLPHADVLVRLCDVDQDGRSWNVCDGLVSLTDAAEPQGVSVTLWPTAYRFRRGHRIRVQVASGTFPRYTRNPGTGESPATATTLLAADQTVHFGPDRPSAITLPVLGSA
ncbi:MULTISPECIES: CocE/NonD family hydrolase [Streptomyces]|uniref:CocE/NonD family hydrolase n=2 Tax=Streptomyces TaxID=1883 RepID=A0ABX0DSU7_9ACTN|nr:CocE/NonD family hydrolase [Streptomyces ureilyticus]NGO43539.1 CocE/NonD family hydrolase [Streptomyces ureilyticus]WSZ63595.1 CocE/NonD family hydrolase [Streptomyces canus]